MATVTNASTNQIKLNNGSVVTANTGGWYDGQQYWGGSLSSAGVINANSNQQGAGQAVSGAVNNASAQAQGVSPQNFNQYLSNLSAKDLQSSVSVPYSTNANTSYIGGLTSEVTNARTALDQNLSGQRTQTQAELATAKAKENTALGEVQKLTTPFRADLETTQRAELGTDKVLSEQRSLLSELDTLLTQGNELIKQQKEVTGLASIRNPRIQKTMDDVSARAGVINAVVSLQNTYLSNAYTSIDRSVNAITQDRQDQLNYYSTILNLANRDIVSLTAEDKKLAEEQTNLLKNDLGRAQETADKIKDLMINPSTAMVMAQSGVTLNDSVEVINQKMAKYQYTQEVKELSNKFTSEGGVLVTDPSTVPASQLRSFTDSNGKTYYYKMPKAGTTTNVSSNTYLENKLKLNSSDTKSPTNTVDTPPNYKPPGGVGSTYVNPSTGSVWQYTSSGWKKIA